MYLEDFYPIYDDAFFELDEEEEAENEALYRTFLFDEDEIDNQSDKE